MIVPGCLWCEIDSRSKSTWRTSCFTSLGRNLRNPLGSSNETRKPEQFYIIARILTLQICLRKVACLLRFFRMREKPTGSWLDKREEKYESNLANEVFPLFFFFLRKTWVLTISSRQIECSTALQNFRNISTTTNHFL